MFSVKAQNNIVALRDIKHFQLESILSWYNASGDFRFATGMENPVGLDALEKKYLQAENSSWEFFLGIHSLYESRLVGIITGKLAGKILWINTMAVDSKFQGKGYGSISLELLLMYMVKGQNASNVYLAVADKNVKGHSFWLRNGFSDLKRIENGTSAGAEKYNIIIMHKRLLFSENLI